MEHIKDLSNIIGLSSTTSLVSNLINSITTISKNVYNLLDLSKNTHTSELILLLERTDIKTTIMLLQSVLTELLENQNKIMNKSIVMAIDNVKEIIQMIETELTDIHKKIEYNSTLYIMSSMRSYDCNINLTNMETKISILDKRRDNLFRVIDVFH